MPWVHSAGWGKSSAVGMHWSKVTLLQYKIDIRVLRISQHLVLIWSRLCSEASVMWDISGVMAGSFRTSCSPSSGARSENIPWIQLADLMPVHFQPFQVSISPDTTTQHRIGTSLMSSSFRMNISLHCYNRWHNGYCTIFWSVTSSVTSSLRSRQCVSTVTPRVVPNDLC